MAAPPLPYVHLEAVEAAEDEGEEPVETRSPGTTTVNRAISKERLAQAGYYSILDRYESLHLCG